MLPGAQLISVVDVTAGSTFWLGRSVRTESRLREPAMPCRTGRTITDQSESDRMNAVHVLD